MSKLKNFRALNTYSPLSVLLAKILRAIKNKRKILCIDVYIDRKCLSYLHWTRCSINTAFRLFRSNEFVQVVNFQVKHIKQSSQDKRIMDDCRLHCREKFNFSSNSTGSNIFTQTSCHTTYFSVQEKGHSCFSSSVEIQVEHETREEKLEFFFFFRGNNSSTQNVCCHGREIFIAHCTK